MIKIKKINRRLRASFGAAVQAELCPENRSIVVRGELPRWEEVLRACGMAVHKKGGWHVVNRIECAEAKAAEAAFPERLPLESDQSLEGQRVDVLVIGGGISGASVLRELSRYQLTALLVEKESDLAMQASSRNDGEVHPGVDQGKRCLKQHYVLAGNARYEKLCRELGVPFDRCGQYVAFSGLWLLPVVGLIALQRRALGVRDTRILLKKALYEAQPRLAEGYDFALYNPSAGTVCPYSLTIACAENAVQNGAQVSLGTAVLGMEVKEGRIVSVRTNRGTVYPKVVVNAAGCFADRIAEMAGDGFFSLHPRRGTELILDRRAEGLTSSIVSFKTLAHQEKNTKGGGILHTVHGNILVGPDAVETPLREDFSTSPESIDRLLTKQKKTIPALSGRDIITYFTGVRAASFEEDFIIEKGRMTENLVHCAAIQSPGLTAAPAFSVDVAAMAVGLLGGAEEKADFDPIRRPIPRLAGLPEEERAALIAKNPDYGVIICRCEEVSRGEILDALRSPVSVPTLDAVKRRVRPGMGRCQGGFCSPLVQQIIAEYLGVPTEAVTKKGRASYVTAGPLKGAEHGEL